jgi:hypothetical protein
MSGATRHHQACVKLHIALVALIAVQQRIGIDLATRAWTLGWQRQASKDCDLAHDKRQRLTESNELESTLPKGSHWTGRWVIGIGGSATACLYIRYDDNGAIMNRVVAKDSHRHEQTA